MIFFQEKLIHLSLLGASLVLAGAERQDRNPADFGALSCVVKPAFRSRTVAVNRSE